MSLFDTKDNKYVEDNTVVTEQPETLTNNNTNTNTNTINTGYANTYAKPVSYANNTSNTYEAPSAPVETPSVATYTNPYANLEANNAHVTNTYSAPSTANEPAEVAFISSTTRIDGNISTQGHLVINGTLMGQASAKGNLVLNGDVTGDVECNSVVCEKAVVRSNIVAQNNVVVKSTTSIVGDIACNNITIYGEIQGNITATGSVVLKASAVVTGNIKAARIGIESGSKISGNVAVVNQL